MGHRWKFLTQLDARAFASGKPALAVRVLRGAVVEIRKTSRSHPLLAAGGAVALLAGLEPALRPIHEESGSLRHAVARTLDATIDLLLPASETPPYPAWLDQLGARFLDEATREPGIVHEALGLRWGKICATPARANHWAQRLLPGVERSWSREDAYSSGGLACLSSLIAGGQFERVLALVEQRPVAVWLERQFGVHALVSLGRVDEAITYAQASNPLGHHYSREIAQACEAVLLAANRRDEAYRAFAIAAGQRQNCLLTYRALAAKYPEVDASVLLGDLIASTPGDEGRWFATARFLRFFQLAIELAMQTPCDPRTLNRAAKEHLDHDPQFARDIARASLKWLIGGHGVEITAADVYAAYDLAKQGIARCGEAGGGTHQLKQEIRRLCAAPTESAGWVRELLNYELAEV